jgi:hypothetical protein
VISDQGGKYIGGGFNKIAQPLMVAVMTDLL